MRYSKLSKGIEKLISLLRLIRAISRAYEPVPKGKYLMPKYLPSWQLGVINLFVGRTFANKVDLKRRYMCVLCTKMRAGNELMCVTYCPRYNSILTYGYKVPTDAAAASSTVICKLRAMTPNVLR